jgi:hypothetical protein
MYARFSIAISNKYPRTANRASRELPRQSFHQDRFSGVRPLMPHVDIETKRGRIGIKAEFEHQPRQ